MGFYQFLCHHSKRHKPVRVIRGGLGGFPFLRMVEKVNGSGIFSGMLFVLMSKAGRANQTKKEVVCGNRSYLEQRCFSL